MGALRPKRVSGSDQELVRNTMLRNRTFHTRMIPGIQGQPSLGSLLQCDRTVPLERPGYTRSMAPEFGRTLVLIGTALALMGLFLWFGPRIPFIGRLPGDIAVERENLSVYAPVTSMIVISVVLSIIVNLLGLIRR